MAELFPSPLEELLFFTELKKQLSGNEKKTYQVTGCVESQKVHMMTELGKSSKWKLLVAENDLAAKALFEDYTQFESECFYYPAKDLIFYQADMQGQLLEGQRIRVLQKLQENKGGTIITSMAGLMNVLPSFDAWKKQVLCLETAQAIPMETLRTELMALGYTHTVSVEDPGQYSIRGGIVDIYPFSEENPVRIEYWDDEIDSIRSFDADSQRSIKDLEEITLYPAREFVISEADWKKGLKELRKEYEKQYALFKEREAFDEALNLKETVGAFLDEAENLSSKEHFFQYMPYFTKERKSLLDYFPEEEILVFLNEPVNMEQAGEAVYFEFEESMKHRLEKGYILSRQSNLMFTGKEVFSALRKRKNIAFTSLDQKLSMLKTEAVYHVQAQNMNSYKENLPLLVKDLEKWHKGKYRVILLYSSRSKAKRMAEYLQDYELDAFYSEEDDKKVLPGQVLLTCGNLHKGFCYPMLKFIVLTETDLFGDGKEKKRRKKSAYKGVRINQLSELNVGDFVVHENYGLGIYAGIEKKLVNHIVRDYIKIEYADKSSLFIPATQFEYIQKYASADKEEVKLNNLYGPEWKKTKNKVRTSVQKVAVELVRLYAARQNGSGYAFSEDTLWQREFEEMFPFQETDDQLLAIEATKKDMESPKIMDRLVCGDVGFGKTEIAIRAAFKAVQDGKQVVYLVPTTILAQQHYNNFAERMKDYPVRVDMLSRFRTKKQIDQTLADLSKGAVDIVIGTHRLLSKDVKFKDLGLLIIDEEQRFGVTHKEKIKQMKEHVDVLTLTATPIPRTLHMSLIGVRDMSVLEEAPGERIPIQTYVCEDNRELVREAISRELSRNGQVYYVYNRVTGIGKIAEEISEMVPQANVAYAHGQMSERQLEKIMLDFINGEIDVLVSTTIIETGLDIPNVNTIIIHDADRFGLSQLYQLRGRVGRSNRTSYAFILYKKNKQLKEVAAKRLAAIREFTELGSGMKIALRDLEIRGAGNLLGAEQHGHMEAVGYDLYCKMLNEEVQKLQGTRVQDNSYETHIEIPFDAYIPDDYIENENMKLDMYKRITMVENEEEYLDAHDELIDRFGDPPAPVSNLLVAAYLKAEAHSLYIENVKVEADRITLSVIKEAKYNPDHMAELLNSYKGKLSFAVKSQPEFTYKETNKKECQIENMVEILKKLLNDIKTLLL